MTLEQNLAAIQRASYAELLRQVMDRVEPILTHKRPPSHMSIPVDFDNDDVYVMSRLNELLIRLG